jgi:carbon monoxide dehydrogenase subunit G
MTLVTASIDIDAPREEVYETMLDPKRLDEWVTIHRRVNHADDGPLRVGYEMDQTLHLRGASFKVHWRLTEYEPNARATWEGSGPAGSYARTSYRLADADADAHATHFEYENEFKAPGGFIGNAASRVLVGGVPQREANRSLQRLKALLER